MRVSSHGGLLGPVDEDDMKALRAQLDNVDIPPLPQSFRGESYGTNQLLMSWQEKEVGPLGCSFPSSMVAASMDSSLEERTLTFVSFQLHHFSLWPRQRSVMSNTTGLSMTFLGTSQSQATAHRAQTSMAMMRAKDVIIFDAGLDKAIKKSVKFAMIKLYGPSFHA